MGLRNRGGGGRGGLVLFAEVNAENAGIWLNKQK